MTRDCVREDVREVKRALISGGIRCVLWGLAAQMPTALIRAANEELRTVTLTWRIPTRTCLGLPLAAIAAGERGGVAQLVRASACHAEGRGFESRHSRHCSMVASHHVPNPDGSGRAIGTVLTGSALESIKAAKAH